MGFFDYLFDSERRQRHDINDLHEAAQHQNALLWKQSSQQQKRDTDQDSRVQRLEDAVGALTLLCKGLMGMLKEKGVWDEEAFVRLCKNVNRPPISDGGGAPAASIRYERRRHEPPRVVLSQDHLIDLLAETADDAARRRILTVARLVADQGNTLGIVLGGHETVLIFTYGDPARRPYASLGPKEAAEPVLTCHLLYENLLRFPRRHVIPASDGIPAALEFFKTGDLPNSIEWEEVELKS